MEASSRYRFGVEEEYFLSDQTTRLAVTSVSRAFLAEARGRFPTEVQREMLQSQIEVATPPCEKMGQARGILANLRGELALIAARHGLTVLAAGTHPSAAWLRQRVTSAARYDRIMRDLQMLGSRNQVCGLHVHVEVPDPEARISIMARMLPYLPLILALSTSSPFWQGHRTGLMGYRLAAYRELPRTGLPEMFADAADYQRYLDIMVSARAIENSSFVWWAIRPSRQHPTLELRVADSCTRVEDSVAIAALYRCLVRRLDRDRMLNAGMAASSRAIVLENLWRAQRYGVHAGLVDEHGPAMQPFEDALERTLALIAEDADALGCEVELDGLRDIVARGASADGQLAIFEEARARLRDTGKALGAVVDWLVAETRGAPAPAPRACALEASLLQ
jgi:carboxylate-amine ligase